VYNVPTIEPAGAYFLAMLHAGAFVADLALLKLGYGNGGDVFLKLALFDNAVVYDSQWVRCFTACLVDFGLLHFATVNLALVTIGAEAEAILGTSPFLTVYILSAAMGGIGSMALDPSTLHVTSSDGLFGVFGAMLVYAAINVENEWNMKGFTVRLLYCGAFASALQYLTSVPTEDGGHVVNSVGHLWGFVAGIAMGYTGLSPMFTSKRFETPPEDRMNVVDVTSGPPKTFAALGALSFTILSLCVVVLLKRTLDVDPRDVF
jgi:membrane associated rhomboid family serine protease